MHMRPEGNAILYCQGAFGTAAGKIAHGLVRRSERYNIVCVVDSRHDGEDAGEVLDGRRNNIPIFADVDRAINASEDTPASATHLVIAFEPEDGKLPTATNADVATAIRRGLNVDSGLHEFLSEDPLLSKLADNFGSRLRDIRKPPSRDALHFFSGKIDDVDALKIAVLGTDNTVGKRTTAWAILDALRERGIQSELIGTGQTAWLQGARYSIIMDALIKDFISGEVEHAIWKAWQAQRPEVLLLEGQGSLLNPAYPGGYELIAAGRPDAIVLQHAPARKAYAGFPDFKIHGLAHQIKALEVISGKAVIAVTINSENMTRSQVIDVCARIRREFGIPAIDTLRDGCKDVVARIVTLLR